MEMNSIVVSTVKLAPMEMPAGKQNEKRDVWGHMLIRPLHTRLTHLWASSTPFLGILVSRRWSFPSWDHPAQPEACIYLLQPNHPLKTKAWVATPSEMTMNPSLETRQLQVEDGKVYSVQSYGLKTEVSDWKLENWGELCEHWEKEVGWKRFLEDGPELNGLQGALRPPCRRKVEWFSFPRTLKYSQITMEGF